MVFSDQTYSVLVVSAAQKFNEALTPLLPGSQYYPVCCVPNIVAARRELLSKDYDFVIVNAPLPDDFGTRFAVDACSKSGTVALLLARADVFDEVEEKVSSQGVFTLQKPTSLPALQQSLKWMAAARERLRRMEEKATSIEEKMEELISKLHQQGGKMNFFAVFSGHSRSELIATFLAVLELIKLKTISVYQQNQYGEIEIAVHVEDKASAHGEAEPEEVMKREVQHG